MAANRRASGILVEAPRSSAAVAAAARARTILLSWPVLLAAILALALGLRLYQPRLGPWPPPAPRRAIHLPRRLGNEMAFVWGLLRYPTLAAEPEPGGELLVRHVPALPRQGRRRRNRPLGIRRFLPGRTHAHGAVRHGNRPARVRDRIAALVAASGTARRAALCAHRAPDPARPLLDRRPIPDLLQRRDPLSVDQDRPLGWSGQLSPLRRCDRPRAREQGDCADTGRVAGCGGRAAGGHFGPRQPDCGADQHLCWEGASSRSPAAGRRHSPCFGSLSRTRSRARTSGTSDWTDASSTSCASNVS